MIRNPILPLLIAFVALALLPTLLGSAYYVNLASQILIAAILAMSLNLLVGFGGLTSLGHAAYLGTSAYLTMYLTAQIGLSPALGIALALVGTTLLAMVFGFLALRATGLGFLMITLALGQILWGLAFRWVSVTGGDNGLGGLVRPQPFGLDLADPTLFFYLTLLVFALAFAAMARFVGSPFGVSLAGARDQPRRMRALGFNVPMIQWASFVYAGFWGGVSGILYAQYHQFVSPQVLHLTTSAETLLMVIAGGAGTLTGPLVGAALVLLLKNVASIYITRWVFLLGATFVVIVLFMPDGIVPWITRVRRKLINRFGATPKPSSRPAMVKDSRS